MLVDLYQDVEKAFEDKKDQISNIERYWQIYNGELTVNQAYQGNAQIYLPLVRDAVEARVTRWTNMLFPENEQHVDVISHPGDTPHGIMALLNHYVKQSRLRHLTPALLRNGEVEGHYALYVSWQETTRYITKKVVKAVEVGGVEDPEDTYTDVEDDKIVDATPAVDIVPLADYAVIPATADDIEVDAEVVARILRLTKAGVRRYARDGVFTKKAAQQLVESWPEGDPPSTQSIDKKKVEAAGVKTGGKYAVIFECWKRIEIDGKRRWCRIFFGGQTLCLGFKVNPNWNDRCSMISCARTKVSGSHYGKSPVDAVEQLQYQANDAVNMGMDSAQYSLMPLVLTDPTKNPNYASMVLSLAAVWQTNPNDTQFVQFPPLWKDAFEIIAQCKSQIMQSFGLNPAMMAQGVGGKKPSQAQVAQENLVAIENTSNEVSTLEEALYSPVLERFFELDQQHRNEAMTVKIYGQMGIAAQMEEVPPFAWDARYEFRWRGVQVFRSQQLNQQMIAGMNILRSLPPVLSDGKRIDLAPIVEALVENIFGPRLGSRILVDQRDQLGVDPMLENDIIEGGVDMPPHLLDDDQEHLRVHMQAVKDQGDPTGLLRTHILKHMLQIQEKQKQANPQGAQGQPGPSAGVAPGAAGTPKPGAQPMAPRGGQQPPGAVHQDRLQDAGRMPRRAIG